MLIPVLCVLALIGCGAQAKVQASIQGDVVRVTGKDRDTLQDIIAQLKAKDFNINMQYTNYRSN